MENNKHIIRIKVKTENGVETMYYSGSNDFSFMYEAFFSRDINMAELWCEKPEDNILGEFNVLTDRDTKSQPELYMWHVESVDILKVKRETIILEEE